MKNKVYEMEDRIFATRVTVPEFEIFSNPTVKISDISKRRFNLFDRFLELDTDYSIKCLTNFTEHTARREYIVNYIRDHKRYNNLRAAIIKVCPEYEEMLDKLLILK